MYGAIHLLQLFEERYITLSRANKLMALARWRIRFACLECSTYVPFTQYSFISAIPYFNNRNWSPRIPVSFNHKSSFSCKNIWRNQIFFIIIINPQAHKNSLAAISHKLVVLTGTSNSVFLLRTLSPTVAKTTTAED